MLYIFGHPVPRCCKMFDNATGRPKCAITVLNGTNQPRSQGLSSSRRPGAREETWGPFLEAPGHYRARSAVLVFILDSSFKRFENWTVKFSAKETKWTSLEVKTHLTFLENLISKYDFGPIKLPGLSRNGPQPKLQGWKDERPWERGCVSIHNATGREKPHCVLYRKKEVSDTNSITLIASQCDPFGYNLFLPGQNFNPSGLRSRPHYTGEIWKWRVYSENASNVFRPHYAGGIWKRNNHRSFGICVWERLGQGNHVIIVTSSFWKAAFSKWFPSTRRFSDSSGLKSVFENSVFVTDWKQSYVFKFLRRSVEAVLNGLTICRSFKCLKIVEYIDHLPWSVRQSLPSASSWCGSTPASYKMRSGLNESRSQGR